MIGFILKYKTWTESKIPFKMNQKHIHKCTGKLPEIKEQRKERLVANLWAQVSDANENSINSAYKGQGTGEAKWSKEWKILLASKTEKTKSSIKNCEVSQAVKVFFPLLLAKPQEREINSKETAAEIPWESLL